MAVKIRLKRMGAKKNPFYRVVVADSRVARNGRSIEELGFYDPISKDKTFKINEERTKYWMSTGAQPTQIVEHLFKVNGISLSKDNAVEEEKTAQVEESAE